VRSKNKKKTQHNQTLPKTSGFNADERGEKRGIRGNDREDRVNNPEDCAQSQANPKYRAGETCLIVDFPLHLLLRELRAHFREVL
jgi:hypothetical protein